MQYLMQIQIHVYFHPHYFNNGDENKLKLSTKFKLGASGIWE
jgi:hypothetical protein